MYINIINNPPIIIMNVAIANHDDVIIKLIRKITAIVCSIRINPIETGLFKNKV